MNYRDVYCHIVEQPAEKSQRFRYDCEGRSAAIPGRNSTAALRTYPTLQIENYTGSVIAVVSCVSQKMPYVPHPNQLVGPTAKYGCVTRNVDITAACNTIQFNDLSIKCMKRTEVLESLELRRAKRIDPFKTGYKPKQTPKDIDLKAVRLCFQIFLCVVKPNGHGKHNVPIPPIVSEPIFDKRYMFELNICNISDSSAAATGGRKIMIFCEKVNKDDITVRFTERIGDKEIWSAVADEKIMCVHHQVAIAFKVPPFRNEWIDQPTKNVMVQLVRPSDGMNGSGIRFTYTPDVEYMSKQQSMKRLRRNETQSRELYQLISDHLNDDKKLPLLPHVIHANSSHRDHEVPCPRTMKRKRQKENRSRDFLESLSQNCNPFYKISTPEPNNNSLMFNIIKEEEQPDMQLPNFWQIDAPNVCSDVITINPTNPFACDMINSNDKMKIIDELEEYKPQNTDAICLTGHSGIYVDSNGHDYHVLSRAQPYIPPIHGTNPFRQSVNSCQQAPNLFEQALLSLDGKMALPLLDLNSNDLACKSANASDTARQANKPLGDTCKNNYHNMTMSFSSLTM